MPTKCARNLSSRRDGPVSEARRCLTVWRIGGVCGMTTIPMVRLPVVITMPPSRSGRMCDYVFALASLFSLNVSPFPIYERKTHPQDTACIAARADNPSDMGGTFSWAVRLLYMFLLTFRLQDRVTCTFHSGLMPSVRVWNSSAPLVVNVFPSEGMLLA